MWSRGAKPRWRPREPARLVFLAVDEGDRVKKGQLIARLDDSDVAARLRRARENLRVAEADLDDAKKNFERMQKSGRARAPSRRPNYDAADARYKRVLATIEAAKFAVQRSGGRGGKHAHHRAVRRHGLEEECRCRRNRRAAGRRRKLEGGGGHHRRYVIVGSRCRRFGGEYHARQRRTRIAKSPWMPIRSSVIPATSAISCPPRTAPRRR